MLISKGNSKMGLVQSFSLSTKSCDLISGPKIQGCAKHCYAKKLERIYPAVKKRYLENLKISKRDDFVDIFCAEFDQINKKGLPKVFRIHVSGDFYSPEYIYKWYNICLKYKSVQFYAYTKAHEFQEIFKIRPQNLILILSDDIGVWNNIYGDFDKVAKVVPKETVKPDPGFALCPGQKIGCANCGLCYKNVKVNIAFRKH